MNSHPLQIREMGEVVRHDFGAQRRSPGLAKPFTSEDETALREALKRCSAVTVAAACEFRKTGEPINLGLIVVGIIERFVDRDLRTKLKLASPELRLVEDLGVDSLTMIEIVMLTEEVLDISIGHEELRPLRTLEDIARFVEAKVRAEK